MTHPCALFSADALSALRAEVFSRQAENDGHVVPGVYFSWDAAEGGAEIALTSEAGSLLSADVSVSGRPRWLTLNISLGASVFDPGDVIGLAADLSADETCDLSVFIRSMQDGELTDTQFGDHVEAGPDRNVVAVLHTVTDDDGLASAEDFHTLVIRLPMRNSKLALGDLRLFVIPASRGLRSKAATLASFSA